MRRLLETLIVAALLVVPSMASAQILLHTGTLADGTLLSEGDDDPRWELDGGKAEVRDPAGGWIPDNGLSKWLDIDDGGSVTISFDLDAAEAASSRIDGRIGIDDWVEKIYINGSQLNVPNRVNDEDDDPWGEWVDFTVVTGFEEGTNVLRFDLVDEGNPGGFRAELELTVGKGYEFNDMCVPSVDHDLRLFTPNVTIMLDTSGSMNNSDGYDIDGDMMPDTRFEIAEAVIGELADGNHLPGPCTSFDGATCDSVLLGVGYFAYSSAFIDVAPSEDSGPLIVSSVGSRMTGGGTPLDEGVQALLTNQEPLKKDIGVVITDGKTDGTNSMRRAIDHACDIRANGDSLFVVGFGPDTNEEENSALAAAGGTGQCCNGPAPCGVGPQIDPCVDGASAVVQSNNDIRSGVSCVGARVAGGTNLKTELKEIMEEGECTFSLDVPTDYPGGKAFEDPAATRVRIRLPYVAGGYVDVPNISDPDRDLEEELEAAYGTSGGSGGMGGMGGMGGGGMDMGMSDMGSGDMSSADMNSADMNSADMNSADMGADMGGGTGGGGGMTAEFADFAGEGWEFTDSSRASIRFTDGLCKLIRRRELTEVNTQLACACTKTGAACSFTLDASFASFTTYQLERLRCSEGVFECVGGKDRCSGTGNAMPEICNGFDDDCDGIVDNLAEAKGDWQPYIDEGVDPEGLHCGFVNSCACETPGYYDTPSAGGDIEDHKDSFTGTCQCSSNLVFDDGFSEPASESDDVGAGAACSSGGFGAAIPSLVVLLGLALLARRRD